MSIRSKIAQLNHNRGRGDMVVIVDDQPVQRVGIAKTQRNSAGEVTRPYECMRWDFNTGSVTNGIEWLTDAQIETLRNAFEWTH